MLDEPLTLDDVDATAENTALLVVDMVNEFVAKGGALETPAARDIVPRLEETIEASRDAGVQVVYFRPRNRSTGVDAGPVATITPGVLDGSAHAAGKPTEVYDPLSPAAEDVVIDKHRYDGFFETELDSVLKTADISYVAVTGTATHICCESTARSAFSYGYLPIVLEDCTATYGIPDFGWGEKSAKEVEEMWFSIAAHNFGVVTDSERYLATMTNHGSS